VKILHGLAQFLLHKTILDQAPAKERHFSTKVQNKWLKTTTFKGLGSLTTHVSISALPILKKNFYKDLQNFTMVTKYNLFTVNNWIFATLKSILYKLFFYFYLCIYSETSFIRTPSFPRKFPDKRGFRIYESWLICTCSLCWMLKICILNKQLLIKILKPCCVVLNSL